MILQTRFLTDPQQSWLYNHDFFLDHDNGSYIIPENQRLTPELHEIIIEYNRVMNTHFENERAKIPQWPKLEPKWNHGYDMLVVDDPKSSWSYDRDAFTRWAKKYCNDHNYPYGAQKKMSYKSSNDSKNADRIKTLHPVVRKMAKKHLGLCDEKDIWLRITRGERTFAEQDLLYAQGRTMPGKIVTNAKGGQSWHNYCLAYDVVPLDVNGKAIWDTNDPIWQTVIELGKQAGLEHGIKVGKWIDMPHFQYRFDGLTISEAKDLWKRGVLHSWAGVG